jgi:hypothetical protein
VGLIAIILIFKAIDHYERKNYGCELHRTVYALTLKSKVTDKLIDVNEHNYQTVYYLNFGNKYKNYMVFSDPEFNYMYDFIEPGDSLIKAKNTLAFTIRTKRLKKDTVFLFSTMCKDSIGR